MSHIGTGLGNIIGTGVTSSLNATQLAQNVYTTGTTSGLNHAFGITETDLEHEAMEAPISSLVDLWVIRFGEKWVSDDEIGDDMFWRLALLRLNAVHKLEAHNLITHFKKVFRIIT